MKNKDNKIYWYKRKLIMIGRDVKIHIHNFFAAIHNYFFCLKYPFYKVYNVYTDKFSGYARTWYNAIPKGWRKAFGKQLSKELKKQLIKDGMLYTFRFSQIKEKYGTLRMYNFGCTEEVDHLLNKYEGLSKRYCIYCGRPAQYITSGYVSYLCEKCLRNELGLKKNEELDLLRYNVDVIIEKDK